jgi:hypothetical protein
MFWRDYINLIDNTIFFITYERTQLVSVVLHIARKACQGQTLSLLGQFIGYEQKELLLIHNTSFFIFFEWAQ